MAVYLFTVLNLDPSPDTLFVAIFDLFQTM